MSGLVRLLAITLLLGTALLGGGAVLHPMLTGDAAAQLRPITDRAVVQAGDVVTVDLTSRLEGAEPVRREGVLVEAGAGTFPLALERQLVGADAAVRVPLLRRDLYQRHRLV